MGANQRISEGRDSYLSTSAAVWCPARFPPGFARQVVFGFRVSSGAEGPERRISLVELVLSWSIDRCVDHR